MNKIEFELKGKSGIYEFFNLVNGKRYVGSSRDIYNRLHEHCYNLKNNKSHNKHFQAAWNKYGEDKFIFGILEYCSEEIRFEREQYYIDSLKPEYNLTLQVEANFGHKVSEETKNKISDTLKAKYASGEITTYKQEHNWKKSYVYNIQTLKLVGIFSCQSDALEAVDGNRRRSLKEYTLIKDKYIITNDKFKYLYELENYVNRYILKANSKFGMYIITDIDGEISYHRTLVNCAKKVGISKGTLSKHQDMTIDNPYVPNKFPNVKIYYSNEFIPVIESAVPIEESSELLLGNIGGTPEMDNTEINSEIKKSESSYSVDSEPILEENV